MSDEPNLIQKPPGRSFGMSIVVGAVLVAFAAWVFVNKDERSPPERPDIPSSYEEPMTQTAPAPAAEEHEIPCDLNAGDRTDPRTGGPCHHQRVPIEFVNPETGERRHRTCDTDFRSGGQVCWGDD